MCAEPDPNPRPSLWLRVLLSLLVGGAFVAAVYFGAQALHMEATWAQRAYF